MNRLMAVLALCTGVLGTRSALAGSTNLVWRWFNPLPFGANIAELVVRQGERVTALAEFGQVFSSEDLVTWTRHDAGTDRWLRCGAYFGTTTNGLARLLVAGGESGTILVTDDLASFRRLDLGTTDWIEGMAASRDRLVGVGDNSAIYTSDDGTNWIRRTAPSNFNSAWLRGVTWRTNGVFVAVGEDGLIATSPNGISWTRQNSRTTAHLNRVVPIAGGFCAVGDGGTVVLDSSGNGTNWRVVNAGAAGDLYAAAQEVRADLPGQPTGALVVAGDEEVRSGILAINIWIDETDTRRPAPAPKAVFLAGYWNDTNAVFAGRAGLILTGTRPNVASSFAWSLPDSPPRSWLFGIATNGVIATNVAASFVSNQVVLTTNVSTKPVAVAVGDGPTILHSGLGRSWSTALLPTNAAGAVYLGVASRPGLLVAVGSSGLISYSPSAYEALVTTNVFTNTSNARISVVLTNQVDVLGLAWYAAASPVSATLQGIATSGNRFVATGSGGTIVTSANGLSWSAVPSPTSAFLTSVESSPAGWVATGNAGVVLASPDGTNWTQRVSGTTNWLWRTRWLNGGFVAVGHFGTILTSPDGITWARRNAGVTNHLADCAFVDGTYYAVGAQGTVLGSSDTLAWRLLPTITSKSLQALAIHDSRLFAVGADGSIVASVVTPVTSTQVSIREWPRSDLASLFLLAGEQGQFVRLDRGTNLVDWAESEAIEINEADGTLIFIDNRPSDPARQFFRARSVAP